MRIKSNGLTPRQMAHDLAIGWLSAAHQGLTSDLADLTPAEKREVLASIARLHDQLMTDADLNGAPLA